MFFLLPFSAVFPGQNQLCGTVVTYNTFPLNQVLITNKTTSIITLTGTDGCFCIPCQAGDVLTVEAKGFRTYKIKVGTHDTLRINLVFRGSQKFRELAVGNDHISYDNLTYGMTQLEQENNDFSNYSNIYDLIRGKFPGVQVIQMGESYRIQIRGTTTLQDNVDTNPLYIVNGLPTDDISDIIPVNVKSIDVLKDAAASFYGARGAFGVIVIETKKAR